jgi:hypothetical protein
MEDILINMNSVLKLEQVQEILKDYIEEKTGKQVLKIEATVKDNVFTGFNVKYHSEMPEFTELNKNNGHLKPVKIDKTFKPMVFY